MFDLCKRGLPQGLDLTGISTISCYLTIKGATCHTARLVCRITMVCLQESSKFVRGLEPHARGFIRFACGLLLASDATAGLIAFGSHLAALEKDIPALVNGTARAVIRMSTVWKSFQHEQVNFEMVCRCADSHRHCQVRVSASATTPFALPHRR